MSHLSLITQQPLQESRGHSNHDTMKLTGNSGINQNYVSILLEFATYAVNWYYHMNYDILIAQKSLCDYRTSVHAVASSTS